MSNSNSQDWSIFTEAGYKKCLESALKKYSFIHFTDQAPSVPHVLWRHDVDFSLHRARWMAKTEAELGARSTFFVMLTSPFYNLFEPEIKDLLHEICALGHQIGLHFDFTFFGDKISNTSSLEVALREHQSILETLIPQKVEVFSFHNPDTNKSLDYKASKFAGMVNVYGERFQDYLYCSDSNGYWRYKSLPEILSLDAVPKLHVLTHPAWWTPEEAPPFERIRRCVAGRYEAVLSNYESDLQRFKRENIKI